VGSYKQLHRGGYECGCELTNTYKIDYMEIRNLTLHDIVIVDEGGKLVASYPPDGQATVDYNLKRKGVIDGVVIYEERFRNIAGLPDWTPNILYIVDDHIAEAARDSRTDLLIPNQPVEHTEFDHAYQSLINV
jgi:hypothetical protein